MTISSDPADNARGRRVPTSTIQQKRSPQALLVAGLAIYVVGVVTVAAYRAREDQSSTSDFVDFWKTGRHFLQTRQIVESYGVHNYLPFFTLLVAPLGAMPLKTACVIFNALSLAGFALSVKLIDGWVVPRINSDPRPRASLRIAVPIGLTLVYVTGCLVVGQMALFTLAMLVLSWHSVERRRDGWAGFWLALAVSTKLYPGVLLIFFALKRRWRPLIAAGVWLATMNVVLPAIALGPGEAWRLHREFWQRSAIGQGGLTLAVAPSNKMGYTNESAALVLRRWTRPTYSGVRDQSGNPRFINLVDWSDSPIGFGRVQLARVQWTLIAFQGALVAVAWWVGRHPWRRLSPARLRHEYAAFLLLGLLLSPILWSFYFSLCYLPLAYVTAQMLADLRGRRRFTTATTVTAVWALAAISIASPFLRMCGIHLAATLILFATMLAWSTKERPVATPAAS